MANLSKMTPLEREFHQESLDGCEMLKKEHKYNPTLFLQMIHEFGAVDAVRRLLKTPNYQDGLTKLWEIKRLDCSCEAAVLNPKWASLFTDAEKKEAKRRLKGMNYEPRF
jgi:hypothetical protein